MPVAGVGGHSRAPPRASHFPKAAPGSSLQPGFASERGLQWGRDASGPTRLKMGSGLGAASPPQAPARCCTIAQRHAGSAPPHPPRVRIGPRLLAPVAGGQSHSCGCCWAVHFVPLEPHGPKKKKEVKAFKFHVLRHQERVRRGLRFPCRASSDAALRIRQVRVRTVQRASAPQLGVRGVHICTARGAGVPPEGAQTPGERG